jgi:hypothetical protein
MKYYVTTAVGGSQHYIDHTEMDKVQQYTDYINIMSYDYAGGGDPFRAIILTYIFLPEIVINILPIDQYRHS